MASYFDPVFPFATPAFVFCHNIVIERTSLLTNDTDDNGWPVADTATELAAKAYVSPPDTRELDPSGEAVDTVVHVPNGTEVSHRDMIRVPTGQMMPPQLVGRFRVQSVRPNQADTRVLCTRVADPEGAER